MTDPRVQQALTALAQPIAEFRTLVYDALIQAETYLDAQTADADTLTARARLELGRFAEERVNAARFAMLFPPARHADAASVKAMKRVVQTLHAVSDRGDALFVVDVAPGTRLGAAVDAALVAAGMAFGAVVLSELVRGGRYAAAEHDQLLDATAFRSWNGAERRFAPPLVVAVEGAALAAADLAAFTDGREKIVIVGRGACPPAPLARCITPGTFVAQTCDGSGLDRLAAFEGPAVGALLPEGAAVFVHDPSLGRDSWQRLTVANLGDAPKKSVGAMSVWQMTEDRNLLETLARTPFAVPAPGGGAAVAAVGATDAANRIASWLLGESGLAAATPAKGP